MITHKSDVWSGCVTMMNVLIGKGANIDPQIQVLLLILYYMHVYVFTIIFRSATS